MIILNLILFLVILGIIYWLVSFLPLPVPFGSIIQVLFVLLAILLTLSVLFGLTLLGVSVPRLV